MVVVKIAAAALPGSILVMAAKIVMVIAHGKIEKIIKR